MNIDDDKLIALYKKTRSLQPPAELDAKILRAAKYPLHNSIQKPKRIIWALSSVAVLVLSVNVALKLLIEDPVGIAATPQVALPRQNMSNDAPALNLEGAATEITQNFENNNTQQQLPLQNSVDKQALQQQRQFVKRKPVEVQKSRSMMRETMPSSKAMSEHMLMSDAAEISHQIPPTIPFDVIEISKINKSIIAMQKNNDVIYVYAEKALILTLKRLANKSLELTAYPHANKLGLNIDWTLKPSQLNRCKDNQCPINSIQTGYFENNQLIKVRWLQ